MVKNAQKTFFKQILINFCLLTFLSVFSLQVGEVLAVPIPSSGPIPESPSVPYVPIPEVPPVPEVPIPESPPVPEVPVPELLLSWFTGFTSVLFSWDSTSWEGMKQYAVNHWQSMAQAAEKEGNLLEYFYKFMGFLADQGSRGNLAMLALSVIPFASIGKLFALGSLGPKVTLAEATLKLSELEKAGKVIYTTALPSGVSAVAAIGKGVEYLKGLGITGEIAGSVFIKQALAGNPMAGAILKHEAAHLLGASEVQAYKITAQAFSSLGLGQKLSNLYMSSGVAWALTNTFSTFFNNLLQLSYFFAKGLTKNIWKGYKIIN